MPIATLLKSPIYRIHKVTFSSILDYFIYLCFVGFIFVDFITGVLLSKGLPSIGVPFKLFLMLLIFLSIKREKKFLLLLYFFTLFTLCCLSYFFSRIADFSNSMSMILKIMMYPFILMYLEDSYRLKSYELKRICTINLLVIFFNQLLGIAGLGLQTYGTDGGFGIKGFFYDGNAMAVVCFCLFVFFYSIEKNLIFAFMAFFSSLLIGTKTSVLAIILYFFMVKFYYSSRKTKKIIFVLFISVVFFFYYLIAFTDVFKFQIEKITRLYNLFDGNILSVILSGRNLDLQNHLLIYKENFGLRNLLFGDGFLKGEKIIELDFFDTLFSYGSLFCLSITIAYLYLIHRNRKNRNLLFFNLLIILITFTSGHVWFNTSTALFFVINNVYKKVETYNNSCGGNFL